MSGLNVLEKRLNVKNMFVFNWLVKRDIYTAIPLLKKEIRLMRTLCHIACGSLTLMTAICLFVISASAAESGPKVTHPAVEKDAAAILGPVARVNGSDILAAELKRARTVLLAGQPGAQLSADEQKELDRRVMDQIISAELLYQSGRKLDLKDLDKQVDAKIAQAKGRFASEADFTKAIRDLDMSEKDLREYTRRDLIITNFVTVTIVPKITVSEEEAKKFYDQNVDKFHQDEQVRASHILCGIDTKASAEEKKKAREKAERLRKELANGADFATLAKENSTCPSSTQGGDLGFFGKGQMVPPFEQAVFALKPGEISDVVETQFGYHIIKQTGRTKAETVPFSAARSKIEDYLKKQKINAAVGDFVAEARKTAKIEILLK